MDTSKRKIDTLKKNELISIGKRLKIKGMTQNKNKDELKILIESYLNKKRLKRSNSESELGSDTPIISSVDKHFKRNMSLKNRFNKPEELETKNKKNNFNIFRSQYPAVKKLVAIGDLHGDLQATIKSLKLAGVVSPEVSNDTLDITKIRWVGKDTWVVQLGDQIDRVRPSILINDMCPDNDDGLCDDEGSDLKIICLFNSLHNQAQLYGGACLSILGNHELMNVDGDFRYVSPREFREFGNYFKGSKSLKNSKYPFGYIERKMAFECGGPIATKLANTRFSVLQVGSWIFVHGGITPKIASKYSLDEINKHIRNWLIGCKKPETQCSVDEIYHTDDDTNSPFWTRIFSDHEDWKGEKSKQLFDETMRHINLKNKGCGCPAKGLVMGHSPQFMYDHAINSEYNNKIWRVDVGMSRAFGPVIPGTNDYNNRKTQVLIIKDDNEFMIAKEK